MSRLASDDLRQEVLDALVKHKGDREAAAASMGKSFRTLNRYIHDLNLFDEMEKLGLIKKAGPPRNEARGTSMRWTKVQRHIKKYRGEIDYGELAVDCYGVDNEVTRHRLYVTLNEYKDRGMIANDGTRWFILQETPEEPVKPAKPAKLSTQEQIEAKKRELRAELEKLERESKAKK